MEIRTLSTNSSKLPSILNHVARAVLQDKLIIFPFDTVYVLVVNPCSQIAVNKLLNFKNRWPNKAISVAVANINMAKDFVKIDKNAQTICSNLLPGPFTFVLPGRHHLAAGIEASDGTLGIRIPDSDLVLNLIKILGFPITATSANFSGRSPHYSIISFLNTLSQKKKDQIDLIIDLGQLPKNKPSTVIDLTGSELRILRPGTLNLSDSQTLISKSEKETQDIAQFLLKKVLIQKISKSIVFLLSGDLGSGKTVFSQKIGQLLGVKEIITSPTFNILNEYQAPNIKFLHFDLYRLNHQYEFNEINFLDQFKPNTLSCIEWPENMGKNNLKILKQKYHCLSLNLSYLSSTSRQISFSFT